MCLKTKEEQSDIKRTELQDEEQLQRCVAINFSSKQFCSPLSRGDNATDNALFSPPRDLEKCLCIPEVGTLQREN